MLPRSWRCQARSAARNATAHARLRGPRELPIISTLAPVAAPAILRHRGARFTLIWTCDERPVFFGRDRCAWPAVRLCWRTWHRAGVPRAPRGRFRTPRTSRPGPPLSPARGDAKDDACPRASRVELVAGEPDIVNPGGDDVRRARPDLDHREPGVSAAAKPGRAAIASRCSKTPTATARPTSSRSLPRGSTFPRASPWATAACGWPTAPDILVSCRIPTATARPTSRKSSSPASAATTRTSCPTRSPGDPTAGCTVSTACSTAATSTQGGKQFDFTCALFRIHPRTREFQLFAEGHEQPLGRRLGQRGQRVRQRLRDRSSLAPDRDRLLPSPGRAVSAVHLADRLDRQAQAPEGGLLRHPLLRQRRLSARVSRAAVHGQHPRRLHQRRRARARRLDVLRHARRPIF